MGLPKHFSTRAKKMLDAVCIEFNPRNVKKMSRIDKLGKAIFAMKMDCLKKSRNYCARTAGR